MIGNPSFRTVEQPSALAERRCALEERHSRLTEQRSARQSDLRDPEVPENIYRRYT